MSPVLILVLLAAVLFLGLLMIPLGLPGLWVMLGAALVYWMAFPAGGIGSWIMGIVSAMVVLAEVLEFTVAARYARLYGGSQRAAWGAILGGLIGAVAGVPVPLVGSVIGAFAGAFVGAFVAETTVRRGVRGDPVKVATGALLGRIVAAALKVAIGLAVAATVLGAAILGG